MVSLSKNQVCLIEEDVEKAKLTLTHLSDELIDHICCEVENEMKNGRSFDDAYEHIKEQTGIKVLQQIQENTLYLIDKNYRLMKTTMKITGNISLAMLGMGTVLKIFHWPGAGIALLLGFVLLCFFFFPSAIYINNRDAEKKGPVILNLSVLIGGIILMLGVLFKVMHWPLSSVLLLVGWSIIVAVFLPVLLFVKVREAETIREKGVYVLGVIALIIFELSTLFKMMHWPGASILIIVGSVLLVSFFLPLYTHIQFKQTGKITGQYIFLVTLAMYAVVLNSLLAMNVSRNILGRFEQEESNTAAINTYFEKKKLQQQNITTPLSDSSQTNTTTQVKSVSEQAGKFKATITAIKLDLVQRVEGVDKETAQAYINSPSLLSKPDNYDVVNHLMLGADGSGLAKQLKMELDTFKQKALQATSSNPGFNKRIQLLLNTSDWKTGAEKELWEETNFRNQMLLNALNTLSMLERNVCQIEAEVIKEVTKQI